MKVDRYWRARAGQVLLLLYKQPHGRAKLMQMNIKLYGRKDDTNVYRVLRKLQAGGYIERVALGVYQLTELGRETAKGLNQ